MEIYKNYTDAKEASEGKPILRIEHITGACFIVGHFTLELFSERGALVGTIWTNHLLRLGNANHAQTTSGSKEYIEV